MPTIKSPLGQKNVNTNTFKTFEVPDGESEEENYISETPQTRQYMDQDVKFSQKINQLKDNENAIARRKDLVKGKERLTEGAIERISYLIGLTQKTREVKLGKDITFVLRSLKNHELRDVLLITSSASNIESVFEMRSQYLARSIIAISDVDISTFIGSSELEDKLIFVENLDDAVASRLYDEFIILKDEVKSYYGIKNEQDAKEVVDSLKK